MRARRTELHAALELKRMLMGARLNYQRLEFVDEDLRRACVKLSVRIAYLERFLASAPR